ncbi:MAG: Plug domain-containing protein [Beijerinckiaceae bacterium]|nr:Plug domain-containing protein [Beijerinckiaceae bacterium]
MKDLWLLAIFVALTVQADAASAGSASSAPKPGAAHAQNPAPLRNKTGYYVPNLIDSAGREVPIMDIPGSAIVVPRQIIDDQQATSLCGALRNVSGVSCR